MYKHHGKSPRHPIFIPGTHVGIVLNYMRDNINIEHKPEIYDTKQLTICWNKRIITASVLQENLNTINGILRAFSKECNRNLFQSLSLQIFQRCTYSEIRSTHSQNVKRLSKFGRKLKNFAFFCVVIVVALSLKVMPIVSRAWPFNVWLYWIPEMTHALSPLLLWKFLSLNANSCISVRLSNKYT